MLGDDRAPPDSRSAPRRRRSAETAAPEKKMPTKAAPRERDQQRVFSARLPMRISASTTITSTAALMPNSAPSIERDAAPERVEQAQAQHTARRAARTGCRPQARRARHAAASRYRWRASAPPAPAAACRNSARAGSAARRSISSRPPAMRCIIAIWPAGPPKLMQPILSQTLKNSRSSGLCVPPVLRTAS